MQHLYGIRSASQINWFAVVEIFGKMIDIHCGGHNDNLRGYIDNIETNIVHENELMSEQNTLRLANPFSARNR